MRIVQNITENRSDVEMCQREHLQPSRRHLREEPCEPFLQLTIYMRSEKAGRDRRYFMETLLYSQGISVGTRTFKFLTRVPFACPLKLALFIV
jgi:hypothetical protein